MDETIENVHAKTKSENFEQTHSAEKRKMGDLSFINIHSVQNIKKLKGGH